MVISDTTDDERYRNFYSVLKEKLQHYRDAKKHLDRFLSTDFNVFKWIDPDEDRLSDIIADLLDQNGSHGQQRRFLDAFLRRIGKNDLCDKQPRRVTCQHTFTFIFQNTLKRGRFDILVEFRDFVIAIENKPWPWSKEGNEQIGKYSDYLNQKYKGRFCLIFLTSEGDKPTSIEENKCSELIQNHKLLLLSYRPNILDWLGECAQLCESDKFRWFLRDFMDHLEGGQTMSMRNEGEIILAHALENEENLRTTLDIGLTYNELCKQIIVDFLNNLETFVLDKLNDATEWEIEDDLRKLPLKKYHFGFRKKTWKKQYGVALEPQSGNAGDVIIGIGRQYDEIGTRGRRIDLLFQELNNKIRNGRRSDWWEWYHFLDNSYRNWNTKEALIKLHNGEAIEHIGKKFIEIIEVATPIIDEHVRGSK